MATRNVEFVLVSILIMLLSEVRLHGEDGSASLVIKRFRQLDRRISLLREEFQTELAMISMTSAVKNNPDLRRKDDINNVTNLFENRVSDVVKSVKHGLVKEKVFRRDLQEQVRKMKDDQIVLDESLVDLIQALTRKLNEIEIPLIETRVPDEQSSSGIMQSVSGATLFHKKPKDCADLYRMGHITSGVYSIHPDPIWRPIDVYCDMETDGGGWTVFQRRCDGSENFFRDWVDYRFGFGNFTREFWLGNEFIHRIVSMCPHELRIELEDFDNDPRYAKYLLFSVGSVDDGFKLTIDGFRGNVTDSLTGTHNGQQFSTKDKGPSKGCSNLYKGGFWYKGCHKVNINGLYLKGKHESHADGVNWKEFRGYHYSLKFTEMKFKSK